MYQARPPAPARRGRIIELEHDSVQLAKNPWGDASMRTLPVYLPAGYETHDEPLPVMVCLAAYTNAGPGLLAWDAFKPTMADRLDRLIDSGELGETIVAFPDCFTSLGGNQYVDSPAVGNYASYLTDELLPLIDNNCRTFGDARHRAVFGKSSGGYGALIQALAGGDHFSAVACHSGDMGFDIAYRGDFVNVISKLAPYEGRLRDYVRDFWAKEKPGGSDIHALMVVCMAASYSPDNSAPDGFVLPFDLHTAELDEAVWQRWLAHDPIEQLRRNPEPLQRLRCLFIDCGYRDQFHLHFGARILHRELEKQGIAHTYEEFNGTHSGIDHRLQVSLPKLYQAMMDKHD